MDKTIGALRKRFTEPSTDTTQQDPLCRICWNDYEGEDRPVMLPCGHVFGEECIIAWSRGITPTGRYNGCPCCRAELLPPSLHSRASALRDWLSDFWRAFQMVLGGPREVAFVTVLCVASICAQNFPQSSKVTDHFRLGLHVLFGLLLTQRYAVFFGWKQAFYLLVGQLVAILFRDELKVFWQSVVS